jgi:peptide/nickel transport system permease protein
MIRFLIRRVLLGLLVIWLVTVATFAIFFFDPAGPGAVAHRICGKFCTPQQLVLIQERLHLNAPIIKQYWYYIFGQPGTGSPNFPRNAGLIHGDLGYSLYNKLPVTTVLKQAFPVTLSLALGAAVIWLAWGILTGIISAIRPRSFFDRFFTFQALFFYSLPTFVLGEVLVLLAFFYLTTKAHLPWFPASDYVGFHDDPFQWFRHLLLPWFTLAAVTAAAYTRLTRGSMLDVMGEDYIRTARAKGLSERRVIFRHGLRAALTPVVTQFGIDLGTLLGGAIITERVFSLDGIGFESIKAITNQDLPVIIGVVVVATVSIVVANIVVDVLYAVLDPRVRLN